MEKEFNVINYDFNSKKVVSYNIIPYLLSRYEKEKNKPKTFDEFKECIKNWSMYQWWARCEYEIIVSPWPYTLSPSERAKEENNVEAWKEHWKKHLNECQKIDIHYQVMMNLDIITKIFMEIVNEQSN